MKASQSAVILFAATLGCVVSVEWGCTSDTSARVSSVGRLEMPLAATSTSGARYRLRSGTFDISGASDASVSTEDNLETEFLRVELIAGDYLLTLEKGWYLERAVPDGGYSRVNAELVSSNPVALTVRSRQTTGVRFRFTAGDEPVDLGTGAIAIDIAVDDARPDAGGVDAGQLDAGGGDGGPRCQTLFWSKAEAAGRDNVPSETGPALRQVSYLVPDWHQAAIEPAKFGSGLAVNQGLDEGWSNDGANFFLIDNDQVGLSMDRGTVEFWFKFKYDDSTQNHAYFMDASMSDAAHLEQYQTNNAIALGWNGWDYGTRGKRFFFTVSSGSGQSASVYTPDYSTDPREGSTRFSTGTLMHFGFVWDRSGIDGSSDTMRIYVDGILRGRSSDRWDGAGELFDRWLFVGSKTNIGEWDTFYNAVYGVTDNLKIYNCAKTEYSDRETE